MWLTITLYLSSLFYTKNQHSNSSLVVCRNHCDMDMKGLKADNIINKLYVSNIFIFDWKEMYFNAYDVCEKVLIHFFSSCR